jgi:hypothetical protein
MNASVILAASFGLFAGVVRADVPPPPVKSEEKPAAAPAAAAAELKAGDLTFKVAAPWELKKEPRRMSAGGCTIPGKDSAPAIEADFYHFGAGGGGGVEPNVARWQKQFEPGDDGKLPEGKREEIAIGGKKVLFVTFKGTFLSGSVMDAKRTPMPGFTMTGVIIPAESGDLFVKIAGPDAAMAAAQADVKKLIASAFPEAK